MYTARVLKGLVAALPLVSQELKPKLYRAIETGNAWLATFQSENGQFAAEEKATIVVLEYLSNLPVPRPTYVPPPPPIRPPSDGPMKRIAVIGVVVAVVTLVVAVIGVVLSQ